MNYKDLFRCIWALLSTPGKAWDSIVAGDGRRHVMMGFVYPLIGLCGLSEFIGVFLGRDLSPLMFQVAMTKCCAVAVSLFGGFFLAAYLIDYLNRRWTKASLSREHIQAFVGYSMVVTFVLTIVSSLFSIAILHWILQIYTIVVVFEGTRKWLRIKEEQQTGFAVIATVILLLCPAVIEYVFNELSVILN